MINMIKKTSIHNRATQYTESFNAQTFASQQKRLELEQLWIEYRKVISLALLRYTIGLKNSRHFLI